MRSYIPILSIAGSDCSGGAGIQADIKTISSIGCYAMTVITALTAQNTCGVYGIVGTQAQFVTSQLDAVWNDITPLAVKTGMLYDVEIVDAVAQYLSDKNATNLVVDPVMVSTSGSLLITEDAIDVMTKKLFPLSRIVTPNINEARYISGSDNINEQAKAFKALGCHNILIKGGDSPDRNVKTDYLFLEGDPYPIALNADAINTKNTHGTGCTLSSAIACNLALGCDVTTAVSRAKLYVTRAIEAGAYIHIGNGHGPLNHLYSPRRMKFNSLKYRK